MAESELFKEIAALNTEKINPDTIDIDIVSVKEALLMINDEDRKVADAVRKEIDYIEQAVVMITKAFRAGGRLIYVGAGTSGRLGVVDASECPPTYGVSPDMVQGIIAGGKEAVFRSQEGAEDSPEKGAEEIINLNVNGNDVVCGIAASGRTPFVIGALAQAKELNASTVFITTAGRKQVMDKGVCADVIISPDIGMEAIAGSTRMKSGTAQKLVLNMLTTVSMVSIGKTYGNVMVDLQLTNAKLKERARRIVMEIASVDYQRASETLDLCNGHVKTAIVVLLTGSLPEEAKLLIEKNEGKVRKAIKNKNKEL